MDVVRKIEELSLNALPALNTTCYDGWLLRYANGYANRANSVNMLQKSALPVDEKIAHCEQFYTRQGLPAVFKITPLSPELDAILETRGYDIVTPTAVMTMGISKTSMGGALSVIEAGISGRWQDSYCRINQLREADVPIAKKVQNNILEQCLCATITVGGEIVACGLCVVERAYAGLFDICVSPQHRRRGYGQDICVSLISAAAGYGAETVYLQVISANTSAVKLYEKIGFRDAYSYWYRVKKQ